MTGTVGVLNVGTPRCGVINDFTGRRFGMLTALSRHRTGGKGGVTIYQCQCDCGSIRSVRHANLQQGSTTSCGCHRLIVLRTVNVSHGQSHTLAWSSWRAMKDRCLRKTSKDYKNYGARGISVCARWAESFEAFIEDMGERPDGATLERTRNAGNYEPGNCVWANLETQNNNKRSNRFIEFSGERLTLAQWARRVGISPEGLAFRLSRWPIQRALTPK